MFQTQGRKKAAAILFIASGILLLFSLTLPYWKIQVMAPQYPKGLGVSIYVDHLAGDVREIDGLNHYIGMKLLGRAAQLERKLAVLGVIAIALAAFASIFARKYFALVLILPILLFPFLFAADLFAWLAYYGLSLDPHAPFSSSIKPFIPPLFGKGVIGQFKALASFQTGFYFSLFASFFSSIGILLRFSARKINFPALVPAISVTGVTVLSFCFGLPEAYAKTISVTSPEAMRQALAGAGEGDMIEVSPGVYPGPWVIEKPVKLAGINFPILDGGGKGTVIKLAAPNIEIKGFVIRGSGDSLALEDTGILAEAPNALIEDNRLEDVLFGISVQHAPNTIVRNNHLSSKKLPVARRGDLIRVWYSDGVILEGNHTWEGRDAVLWFSKRLLVRGNVFQKSRYALHFMYCDDARVEGNVFEDNSVGAYLMYSNRIRLSGNKITNNRGPSGFGVGFKDMEEARIYANLIANNKTGFYFDSA
ncbi:MAG: right-handed parallel beta-helix repeat-containing protein, partial [Candidatus Omnitrophica bacterium]|nr:right-handed parallel beta-helix repeat-containing protein [Candidatus Omnitrophota bacterium]